MDDYKIRDLSKAMHAENARICKKMAMHGIGKINERL